MTPANAAVVARAKAILGELERDAERPEEDHAHDGARRLQSSGNDFIVQKAAAPP